MHKTTKAVITAITSTFMFVSASQAEDAVFFRIGTGNTGGTYYPIGRIIANAISNPADSEKCNNVDECGVSGLVAIAVASKASVYNVESIQKGQIEAGFTDAMAMHNAYFGFGSYQGKRNNKLRIIANLYPEDMHLVLPKGRNLESLKDLRGLRIGIDRNGSGTQVTALAIMAQNGIEKTDIIAVEFDKIQSAAALAEGKIDAYFCIAGTPLDSLSALNEDKGFELYRFSNKEIKSSLKAVPTYVSSTIFSEVYKNIDYDVPTIAVNSFFVTNSDIPEELIYKITKAMWNKSSRKLLDDGHEKGKSIRLENALIGVKIPLHKGAKRFYVEQGMM